MGLQRKKQGRVSVVLVCILFLMLCGCSGSRGEQRIITAYKPARVVQVCLSPFSDTSSLMLRQVDNKLADWLAQAINVNQGGLQFYANLLGTAHDPAYYTVSNIAIPSFPDDPVEPQPSVDPYKNAGAKSVWQKALKAQHARLHVVQAQLKPEIDTLRSLNPPVSDPQPSSLSGCVGVAHLRYSSVPHAVHILIIASVLYPLLAFDSSFLSGVHVLVVRSCPSVAECLDQQNWISRFRAFGAQDVSFVDSATLVHLPAPF